MVTIADLDWIPKITDRNTFLGIAAILFAYMLYMMIRKRKGLRRNQSAAEPEI